MNKMFKKCFSFAIFLFFSLPLYAQSSYGGIMPRGMQGLADSVLDIFTGTFMRVIFAIFLCGSAVAYAFNKDNEKVKRSCIAIFIAAAICIGASGIVGAVWTASAG